METAIAKLNEELNADPENKQLSKTVERQKKDLAAAKKRIANAQKRRRQRGNINVATANLNGSKIYAASAGLFWGRIDEA